MGVTLIDAAVLFELRAHKREVLPPAEHAAAPAVVVRLARAVLEDAVGAAERALLVVDAASELRVLPVSE